MTDENITAHCAAFTAQLKALRMERGLSTYQLADLTGLRAANISRLESGTYPPNLITIMKLATALDAEVVIKPAS